MRPVLAVFAALAAAAALHAQIDPVTILPEIAVRSELVVVSIPNGPPDTAEAHASLTRNGAATDAQVTWKSSHASISVPSDLPYGLYLVTVSFPKQSTPLKYIASKRLNVQPDGKPEVRLGEIDPPTTYDHEVVYIPDKSQFEKKQMNVEQVEITGMFRRDSRVEINGVTVEPHWSGCTLLPPIGSEDRPEEYEVFGAYTPDGLTLCRVPVNAAVRIDGQPVTTTPVNGTQRVFWAKNYNKGRPIHTAHMTLRGSGFLPSQPRDTTLWVDGAPLQHVIWDTCDSLPYAGRKDAPVENRVHAEIVSPNEARVCRIPVPATNEMIIAVGYGDTHSETRAFKMYSWNKLVVGFMSAGIALGLGLFVFLLLLTVKKIRIATHEFRLSLFFLDPETNTYSLSKCQFYMWTLAALFGYAYLYLSKVFVQGQDWPDIPGTLPGIVGIGAGTAIGSQFVTATKGSKGAGDETPNFSDFVTSGGVVAPDRVQMFLWTLFGVGAFCVAVLQQGPGTISGLSPVPEGMLYLMGLSSVGYLGGKLARKPGPVISEVSINPPDSDAGLAEARGSAGGVAPDFVGPISSAKIVLAGVSQVAGTPAASTAALTSAIAATGAAHSAQELTDLLAKLAGFRAAAEQAAKEAADQFSQGKLAGPAAQAAQTAAAALQDFSAEVTQALSLAAAPVIAQETASVTISRTIEIRGSNLSPEATFEIDHAELPFRMLRNTEGKNAPDVLTREESSTLARIMRLTIDPARLATTDLEQYRRWFAGDGKHALSITNPDGQRAELTFAVPPGTAQKTQQ